MSKYIWERINGNPEYSYWDKLALRMDEESATWGQAARFIFVSPLLSLVKVIMNPVRKWRARGAEDKRLDALPDPLREPRRRGVRV